MKTCRGDRLKSNSPETNLCHAGQIGDITNETFPGNDVFLLGYLCIIRTELRRWLAKDIEKTVESI